MEQQPLGSHLLPLVYTGKGYWLEIDSLRGVSNFKPVALTCMLIIYMHPTHLVATYLPTGPLLYKVGH